MLKVENQWEWECWFLWRKAKALRIVSWGVSEALASVRLSMVVKYGG